MLVNIHIENKNIITVDWSQVPDKGESVVIDGKDYEVYARTWFIFNSNLPALTSEAEVHIYLKEI